MECRNPDGRDADCAMKRPYVYIMANRRNGTLYVGVTSDLIKRIHQHRSAAVPDFTRTHHAHMLVWYEAHADMIAAISREKRVKKWVRSAKLRTIELMNPDWKDLWFEIIASA